MKWEELEEVKFSPPSSLKFKEPCNKDHQLHNDEWTLQGKWQGSFSTSVLDVIIPSKHNFTFRLKVDCVKQTYDIMIGVIRPTADLNDDLHWDINDAYGICCFAYDGILAYEGKKSRAIHSSRVASGDIVECEFRGQDSFIKYTFTRKGEEYFSYTYANSRFEIGNWCPAVSLYYSETKVTILN